MNNIRKNITFGRVEEETFVFNSETNNALKFDKQGTKIWDMIYKGYSKTEIKEHFIVQFPACKGEIEKDVDNFFNILQKEQMI